MSNHRLEQTLANALPISLFTGLVSGILLYSQFWLTEKIYTEILLVFHLSVSLYFLLAVTIYLYFHVNRTLKSRRNAAFFTGVLSTIVVVICLYSGIKLLLPSRYELGNSSSSTYLHLSSSLFFVSCFVAHFLSSRKSINKLAKKQPPQLAIPTLGSALKLPAIATILASLVAVMFLPPKMDSFTSKIQREYNYTYGENPFAPSESSTPDNAFIPIDLITQSEKCSSCHTDIFKQWSQSAHRFAAADPSYVKNVNLLEKTKGIESTRYCEGCHSPPALLSGQLTEGGVHGGTPDTVAFNEGISCLSCHSVSAINHTEGVGSYHYTPIQNSALLNTNNRLAERLAGFLIQASPSKHKAFFNNSITAQPASCATCHAQYMDKTMNDWGWVKMQDEYSAWLESPYSGHASENFSADSVTTCQDCHMRKVPSNDPSAGEDGLITSHHFAAANTVIPTYFGLDKQLANVTRFLQSNKIRITLEPPKGNSLLNYSSSLQAASLKHSESLMHFYAGKPAHIDVAVSNTGVGHNFPGGTTDIQVAWLHFQVVDSTGEILYESGSEETPKNSKAIYKTSPVDRHGKAVWKHDLFNTVGDSYKNAIAAGKTDIVTEHFDLPGHTKGPITIHASLRYKKFNDAYKNWVFDSQLIEIPVIEVTRSTISIPVKIEVPAS